MKKSAVIIRLFKYLAAHTPLLILAAALTAVSNLLALIAPDLSGKAIDAIVGEGKVDFDSVIKYSVLMVVFYAASALLSLFLSFVMITVSRKVAYKMRKDVFEHLIELPVGYFDSNQTGDLISRLSYDIDTINTSLSNDLIQICSGAITVVGCAVMMIRISPLLMLTFVVTLPILIFFTAKRVTKIKPLFRTRSAKLGELNGYAEEMLSGQKTIKAYGKEDVMVRRFDLHNADACAAYYKADYEGCVMGPSVNFINNLTLSLVSMLGALILIVNASGKDLGLITAASLTLGSLSSFILYSRRFVGPINETANIISDLQSATSAAERIFRLLDEAPEPYAATAKETISPPCSSLTVNDLDFSYVEGVKVLKNINLTVKKGEKLAIVGPTGSGKTSIINLLMRFYDPDSGEIRINGTDTRKAPLADTRGMFTMVLQETWLFGGTVAENIAYGSEGVTREEIIEAARSVTVHDFIESLENGYDTVITDDGSGISKGQKQLITIARAILIKNPVLILDEATSSVDSRTEMLLQSAMERIMANKTSIVIAHRLSTIKSADKIIVIKDGSIIESGTHDELLAHKGFYSMLFNAQFETSK